MQPAADFILFTPQTPKPPKTCLHSPFFPIKPRSTSNVQSDSFLPSFLPYCRGHPCFWCRRRTPYAKIQARLQFPEGYPTTPLIVELTNASLPHPFLRKLTLKAEEMARGCNPTEANAATVGEGEKGSGGGSVSGGAEGRGTGRAVAALGVILDAVKKNKFLPCWKELRQAAALVSTR